MRPETDLRRFAEAHADGAYVLDVREPGEYHAGHVPGAELMPLASVPRRLSELPSARRIYVICATGNRSLTAAAWLNAAGHDAVSVADGTAGWMRLGGRVVRGPSPHDNDEEVLQ